MTYTYDLLMDERYFRTLTERYYRQRPIVLRPNWQFAFLVTAAFIVFPFVPFDGNRVPFVVISLLAFCGFAAFGLAVIRVFVFQNYRYTSYFGKMSRCTLSDGGVQVSGAWKNHNVDWATLQSAVRFADGMMLLRRVPNPAWGGSLRKKDFAYWLPDSTLQASNPADVDCFVRTKMGVRNVA